MATAGSVGPGSQGLCTFPRDPHDVTPRDPHDVTVRAGTVEGSSGREHGDTGSTCAQERGSSGLRKGLRIGSEGPRSGEVERQTRRPDEKGDTSGEPPAPATGTPAMSRSTTSSSSSSNSAELLAPLRPAGVPGGASDLAGDPGHAEVALQLLRNAVLGSRQGSRRHGRRCVHFAYSPALHSPPAPLSQERMRAKREEALGCRAGTPLRYPLGPSSSAGEGGGQGAERQQQRWTGPGRDSTEARPQLHKVGTMPAQRGRHASSAPRGGGQGNWDEVQEERREGGGGEGRVGATRQHRRWGALFGKMTLSFKDQSSSESLRLEDSPRGREDGHQPGRGEAKQQGRQQGSSFLEDSPRAREGDRGRGQRRGQQQEWQQGKQQGQMQGHQQGREPGGSWNEQDSQEEAKARSFQPFQPSSAHVVQRRHNTGGGDDPGMPSAHPQSQQALSIGANVQRTQTATHNLLPCRTGALGAPSIGPQAHQVPEHRQTIQRAQEAAPSMPPPRRTPPFLTKQATPGVTPPFLTRHARTGLWYTLNPVVSKSDPFLRGPSSPSRQHSHSPGQESYSPGFQGGGWTPGPQDSSSGQPGSARDRHGGRGGRGLLHSFKSWKEPRRLLQQAASPSWGYAAHSPLQQREQEGWGQSQVMSHRSQVAESRRLLGSPSPSWGVAPQGPVPQPQEVGWAQSQVTSDTSHTSQVAELRRRVRLPSSGGESRERVPLPTETGPLRHVQWQGRSERREWSFSGPVLGTRRNQQPSAYFKSASSGVPSPAPPPSPLEPLSATDPSQRLLVYPKSASGGVPAPACPSSLASAFPKSKSNGAATGERPVAYDAGDGGRAEGGEEGVCPGYTSHTPGFGGGRNVITLEELIGNGLVRERVWKSDKERVWKSEKEGGVHEAEGRGSETGLWDAAYLAALSPAECSSEMTGESGRREGEGASVISRESGGACQQHGQSEEGEGVGGQTERTGYDSEASDRNRTELFRYASDSQEDVRVQYASDSQEEVRVQDSRQASDRNRIEPLRYASDSQEELRVQYASRIAQRDQGSELVRYALELLDPQQPVKPMGPPKSLAHRRWGSGIPLSTHPQAAPSPPLTYREVSARARLSEPGRSFKETRGTPRAHPLERGHQSFKEPGCGRSAREEGRGGAEPGSGRSAREEGRGGAEPGSGRSAREEGRSGAEPGSGRSAREEGRGCAEPEHASPKPSPGLGLGLDRPTLSGSATGATRGVPGNEKRRGLLFGTRQVALGLGALRKSPRGSAADRPKLGARMDLDELASEYYAQDGKSPGGK